MGLAKAEETVKSIDEVLRVWDMTKLAYGLDDALIKYGDGVMSYEKWKKTSDTP